MLSKPKVLTESTPDLTLIKTIDLVVTLSGTIIEILPLAEDSEHILAVGVLFKSRMSFFLSTKGRTTRKTFETVSLPKLAKLRKPFYLFPHDRSFFTNYIDNKQFIVLENYPKKENCWGYVSVQHHARQPFYRPSWAYYYAQHPRNAEQILYYLETML